MFDEHLRGKKSTILCGHFIIITEIPWAGHIHRGPDRRVRCTCRKDCWDMHTPPWCSIPVSHSTGMEMTRD